MLDIAIPRPASVWLQFPVRYQNLMWQERLMFIYTKTCLCLVAKENSLKQD
jgi:hypothetical protein